MTDTRILYVDDEEQIRKLLSGFLSRRGYEVVTAADGLEAIQIVEQQLPDLIITDVDMPRCDGIEFTRRLRSDPRTARLPIIMLSAKAQTQDVLAGYAEGADEYVAKPIELAILGAKIETLLRRVAAQPVSIDATLARPSPVERSGAVAFFHAKGGVGGTTLAVNAAVALAAQGRRVCLLDLNVEFADAVRLLGLEPQTTLADLAGFPVESIDTNALHELAVRHSSGVQVIAASLQPAQASEVGTELVSATLRLARELADVVFVDMPPTFSPTNLAALREANLAAIVTAGRPAALYATATCLNLLAAHGLDERRVILLLNHPSSRGMRPEKVAEFLGRQPDAVVPHLSPFSESSTRLQTPADTRTDNLGAIVARDLATRIADCLAAA